MGALHFVPVLFCVASVTTLLILSGHNFLLRKTSDNLINKSTLRRLEKQLPAFLDAVSSSLSSGNSLLQSLETTRENITPPMEAFIHRMITKVRAGMSLETVLEKTADEIGGGSLFLVLHSMAVSYRSGGNMVQSLSLLAHICRERETLQEKIQAKTAQSRMQGTVMTLVPSLFLILLFITSPHNLILVFNTSLGRMMLFGAFFLQCLGFLVIKRMLKQEILG